MTETDRALGAKTAKKTPAAPWNAAGCAPSFS
jgi:hypothetical protein